MILDIVRLEETKEGYFGTLLIDGRVFCSSLELPWLENVKYFSCIPEGYYRCQIRKKWFGSKKYGPTIEVLNVPGRDDISFHPGNWIEDTEGCPLVGRKPGVLRGKRAIKNSGNTFKNLMLLILQSDEKINLRITSLIVDRRKTYFQLPKEYGANHGKHSEAR